VDFNSTEKTIYEEFKRKIGSATVQQIARKNAEAWRSFFAKSGMVSSYFPLEVL